MLAEDSNDWLYHSGLGIYHSGVEVSESIQSSSSKEYSFSQSGIVRSNPRLPEFGRFRIQISIGNFVGSLQDINTIVNRLSSDLFEGSKYNLTNKNCNHFTETFCVELIGISIPSWVNRAASIGNVFTGTSTSVISKVDKGKTNSAIANKSIVKQTNESIFSRLWVNKSDLVIASNVKKDLTDKQKELLLKLKKSPS